MINGGDGNLHLTTAWGVRGAFNHNWDPYWSTSLFGNCSGVRYDDTAKFYMCSIYTANRAVTHSADYSCGLQRLAALGVITRWILSRT